MQISDSIVDQSQQIIVVGAGSGILGKGVGTDGGIEIPGVGEDPALIVVGHRPFVLRAVTVVIVHGDSRQRIAGHIHVVLVQRLRIEQRIAGLGGRRVDLAPVDMPEMLNASSGCSFIRLSALCRNESISPLCRRHEGNNNNAKRAVYKTFILRFVCTNVKIISGSGRITRPPGRENRTRSLQKNGVRTKEKRPQDTKGGSRAGKPGPRAEEGPPESTAAGKEAAAQSRL